MKKYLSLILMMLISVVIFAADRSTSIFDSGEMWIVIWTAAILIIEWVIRAIPTSKPVGFLLSLIVKILNWLITRNKDKKKGGEVH